MRAGARRSSIRHVTGQPLKFIGVGEKFDALEPFHPDRAASRIWAWATCSPSSRRRSRLSTRSRPSRCSGSSSRTISRSIFPRPDAADPQAGAARIATGDDAQGGYPQGLKDVKVDEKEINRVGGDHRFDDAAGTRQPHDRQRKPPPAHRQRQRHVGAGSEPVVEAYAQAKKMMKSFSGGFMGRKLGKMKLPAGFSLRDLPDVKDNWRSDANDSSGAVWRQKEAVLSHSGNRERSAPATAATWK